MERNKKSCPTCDALRAQLAESTHRVVLAEERLENHYIGSARNSDYANVTRQLHKNVKDAVEAKNRAQATLAAHKCPRA